MFDTGEIIEAGFASGSRTDNKKYYGEWNATVEEMIGYFNEKDIDITPSISVVNFGTELEFELKPFYFKLCVIEKFTYDSIAGFASWYADNFGLYISEIYRSFDFYGNYFRNIDIKENDLYKEKLKELFVKYKLSEKHREEAMNDYEEKVYKILIEKENKRLEIVNSRTNALDILFFPDCVLSPFDTSEYRLVQDTVGKSFKHFLNKNITIVKINNKYYLEHDYKYSNFIYGYGLNGYEYTNLEDFIRAFCDIYKIDKNLVNDNFELLIDYFKNCFKTCENMSNDLKSIKDLMKKESSFEIATRTNAKGRTYTNLIFSDYSLSINYKTENEVIKFNKNTRESTVKKSKILYKIIKKINFFK
ncbi:hypothetical protein [Leptotrichia wadei]|uniref:hypothetical protein n=1 Tax=Leptotrichia wadei TaxID=157687 RepID=UPI0028E19CC0|nr:hypothetical protein [Leptotrichia wadei]